jgi:hypothetical protein
LAKQILQANLLSLTTLWAFVECGLGSILHAFHLPITGLVLGGFSCITIYLIAFNSSNVFRDVVAALVVVATIKLLANPATSPFAYLALGFQALLGAMLYSISKNSFVIHFIFAVVAMLESAAQKLLVLTLFMQKSFWQAFDAWVKSTCGQFNFIVNGSASAYFALAYLGFFAIWGVFLAILLHKLPSLLLSRQMHYQNIQLEYAVADNKVKNKFIQPLLIFISIMVLASYFLLPVNHFFVGLLRVLFCIGIWQFIIVPFWIKQSQKWLHAQKNMSNVVLVNQHLPKFTSSAKALWQYLAKSKQGVNLLLEFALGLIILSLNPPDING